MTSTDDADDFFVPDEEVEKIKAAFTHGQKRLTQRGGSHPVDDTTRADAVLAMRSTRAFQAAAAFGLPNDAHESYLAALADAVLGVLREAGALREPGEMARRASREQRWADALRSGSDHLSWPLSWSNDDSGPADDAARTAQLSKATQAIAQYRQIRAERDALQVRHDASLAAADEWDRVGRVMGGEAEVALRRASKDLRRALTGEES